MLTLLDILNYSYLLGIVPVVFYLVFQKKNRDKKLQVIVVLLILGLLNDQYSQYLFSRQKDNYLNYNLFVLVETLLLVLFFHKIFRNKLFNKLVYYFTLGFIAAWIAYYRKVTNTGFVDMAVTAQNITIMFLSVLFFYEQINNPVPTPLYDQPRFWIVVAYFFFCTSMFFFYLSINSVPKEEQAQYLPLFFTISIIRYVLLMIAMYVRHVAPPKNKFQLT